jgi:prophage regulatory protein
MVTLADSTIYEMEQRGEFPRHFALAPMPPLRERTPLSSLTAEAKPARITPFSDSLELRQAAKRPFPIVPVKA